VSGPHIVEAAAVVEGALLGQGGQGQVVEVLTPPDGHLGPLVAKWYLPGVALAAGPLTRMIAWRRRLDDADRSTVDGFACWPRAVLLRNGRAAGVLLPRVPEEFAFTTRLPLGQTASTLRELQFLIAGPELLRRRQLPDVSTADRLRLVAALAEAVSFLHTRGVVLGDLSVKNVLWSPSGAVYLIDCDSLRLTGATPAVAQPNSPGWEDPSFPGTQNQQSDLYKLALVALRVLARSFQGRDPAAAAPVLGRGLTPLLRAALHEDPELRPPASAWSAPLRARAAELIRKV
jgi:DNA-binding helix-hairpin-helix protein with protein kinase domain